MAFLAFEESRSLARALARNVADKLSAAIEARGTASLVVSGGRTPVALFERLAQEPLRWSAVTVTLADERWVAPDHADSNERLVRTHLLQGPAAAARFVPLKNGAASPEEGAAITAAGLDRIARPFDVVLLGMGDDGHTASLFPGAPQLSDGLRTAASCLAVRPPLAPHARMSLSLAALLGSRVVMVQIAGAGKRSLIDRALEPGSVEELPIRAVLHQSVVPVDIYWCP